MGYMTEQRDIKDEIIDIIRRNRISSTEVADALGKTGVISGIGALNTGHFCVGSAHYILGYAASNWPIHEQIQNLDSNLMLFVDMHECGEHAAFGDIVAKYLHLYCQTNGMIINGLVRDNHTLVKENYPIWCTGVTPLGCYNREVEETPEITERLSNGREKFNGGVLVADDSGCTLIERSLVTDETLRKLQNIEIQEDIWYYCIDVLKWSTFDTICLKRYKDEPELLPDHLRRKLSELG